MRELRHKALDEEGAQKLTPESPVDYHMTFRYGAAKINVQARHPDATPEEREALRQSLIFDIMEGGVTIEILVSSVLCPFGAMCEARLGRLPTTLAQCLLSRAHGLCWPPYEIMCGEMFWARSTRGAGPEAWREVDGIAAELVFEDSVDDVLSRVGCYQIYRE